MNSQESKALETLIGLSNHYGQGSDYVIAGGGNTSWKNETHLFIKGSGQALASIQAEGFVQMDRQALAAIWTTDYSNDIDEREKQVLNGLMAARLPGQETKRPSVETLLHDLLPFAYVVHTHPSLVNAITCAQAGQAIFSELFAQEAVWIPLVNPGYILAQVVKEALEDFKATHGSIPAIIFLQNHGIVVAGDQPETIQSHYDQIFATIQSRLQNQVELNPQFVAATELANFQGILADLARQCFMVDQIYVVHSSAKTVMELAQDDRAFARISSAFSPDHIVYMGVAPIRVDDTLDLASAFSDYQAQYGKPPRVVLVRGLGAWCLGTSQKTAQQAHLLFLDAVKIAVGASSFGGPLFMARPFIDFIRNWEVEAYRSKISGS